MIVIISDPVSYPPLKELAEARWTLGINEDGALPVLIQELQLISKRALEGKWAA
jgi:hypothetical protein